MPANYDLSDLQPLQPPQSLFTRVGDHAPLLWQASAGDDHVLYLADDKGLWLRVPDNILSMEFEAITGFRLNELALKVVGGIGVYALKDGTPLLPFPFTAAQLLELDKRTGGVFSERIYCGDETDGLIEEIAQHSPGAAELARAMVYGELPPEQAANPTPVVAVGASGVIHSTKARRDTLTPIIELAQEQCRNPQDTAEVWAALLVLAEKKSPPLIGATEDGLQYLNKGSADIFKKKSLGQRLAR